MSDALFMVDGLTSRLILSGPLTIAHATNTRDEVLGLLDTLPSGDMLLDVESIDEADSSGVQLLLSLVETLKSQGQNVRLASVSSAVAGVAWDLGAASGQEFLGIPYQVAEEQPA